MNPDEIKTLLKAVASGDRRTTGPEDVQFWAVMAHKGRWTLPEAMSALIEFRHSRPGEWLEPGHLSTIIRAVRQDTAMRAPVALELPRNPPPPELFAKAFASIPSHDTPPPVVRPPARRTTDPAARAAARAELANREPAPMPQSKPPGAS